jgi:hypothetical protein
VLAIRGTCKKVYCSSSDKGLKVSLIGAPSMERGVLENMNEEQQQMVINKIESRSIDSFRHISA